MRKILILAFILVSITNIKAEPFLGLGLTVKTYSQQYTEISLKDFSSKFSSNTLYFNYGLGPILTLGYNFHNLLSSPSSLRLHFEYYPEKSLTLNLADSSDLYSTSASASEYNLLFDYVYAINNKHSLFAGLGLGKIQFKPIFESNTKSLPIGVLVELGYIYNIDKVDLIVDYKSYLSQMEMTENYNIGNDVLKLKSKISGTALDLSFVYKFE